MENSEDGSVAIRCVGLTKRYGDLTALDGLNLDVARGEVVGYLGPNGAGKTTTIRLILGLARPSSGRVEVFGLDCARDPVAVHRRLAYVPGDGELWPELTGLETLTLLGRVHGGVDAAYRDQLVRRFDLDGDKKVRAYSKGNRQKVLLVAALMVRPDLLVLDEPTDGLDPLMEQVFRECVREARERGQTVFLSSHRLGEVEALCDRVAIVREGRLVESGRLADLKHLSALIVEFTVDGPAPDLSAAAGVADVKVDGNRVQCRVTGPMAPLLAAVAHSPVRTFLSREPSLEELFESLYGSPDGGEET